MKNILILGSTGSIGVNTLNIIRAFPDRFSVKSLTTNRNIELLEKQIKEFKPGKVVVRDKNRADELRKKSGITCEILDGDKSLIEITKYDDYDILVACMVGFAGLAPTIEGMKRGKRIALANKETLVAAGEMVMELSGKYSSEIIPVDSEHSAIFQCLAGEKREYIKKIILTASGGPFLNKSSDELVNVKVEEALNHPNWSMGNKITIDSATMMNKGLEVIEAHWLFNLGKDKIEVVIHPQSVIHSMVEFSDGSIKAQLSTPDMKLPIQYALTYPERIQSSFIDTNLPSINKLTFSEPDYQKFKCLALAYDALISGGTAPCILNAANEIAVELFLNGKIYFTQIPEIIEYALNKMENYSSPNLETIFECDRRTREFVKNYLTKEIHT